MAKGHIMQVCNAKHNKLAIVPYHFEARHPCEDVAPVDRLRPVDHLDHISSGLAGELHDGAVVHVDGEEVLVQEEVDDGVLVGVQERERRELPRHPGLHVAGVIPDRR